MLAYRVPVGKGGTSHCPSLLSPTATASPSSRIKTVCAHPAATPMYRVCGGNVGTAAAQALAAGHRVAYSEPGAQTFPAQEVQSSFQGLEGLGAIVRGLDAGAILV